MSDPCVKCYSIATQGPPGPPGAAATVKIVTNDNRRRLLTPVDTFNGDIVKVLHSREVYLVIERNHVDTEWGWSYVGDFILPPINIITPALGSDSIEVDTPIHSGHGCWSDNDGISYSYQWQRADLNAANWANLTDQTSADYTPVTGDDSKLLRCVVTATNAAGSGTAVSNVAGNYIVTIYRSVSSNPTDEFSSSGGSLTYDSHTTFMTHPDEVTEIDSWGNGLDGVLDFSQGNFQQLQFLGFAGNQLTDVILPVNFTGYDVYAAVILCANNLTAAKIDALFRNLGTVDEDGNKYFISVASNPGSATCTPSIATNKGWSVDTGV